METEADRLPVVVGVKVTLMVQLFSVPSSPPQVVLGTAKSPGSAPVIVTDVMLSVDDFDPLVRVTVIVELVVPTDTVPKFREVGDNFTTVPVPVRDA
jgi:hypothetical protein